jgi:hypothetical protein
MLIWFTTQNNKAIAINKLNVISVWESDFEGHKVTNIETMVENIQVKEDILLVVSQLNAN